MLWGLWGEGERREEADPVASDEYCPHCDNHFVIDALTPKASLQVEGEDVRKDARYGTWFLGLEGVILTGTECSRTNACAAKSSGPSSTSRTPRTGWDRKIGVFVSIWGRNQVLAQGI